MALSVSLVEPELTVDPGGFVRTHVSVRNTSSQPERVRLRVTGPAAEWSWVVPPEQDVDPGAEAVMNLGFRVPRTAEPAAGNLAFEVVAAPAVGHGTESGVRERVAGTPPAAKAVGVLTVTAFQALAVELDPPDARPTVPTEHHLVVQNGGNLPVSTALSVSSGDRRMVVAIGSEVVGLRPGQRVRVPVSLRPGRRPLVLGRSLRFAVSAVPEGGEPITVPGAMDQPAIFTGRTAGMAIAVAVLLVVAGLRLTVLAPGGSPTTDVAATVTTGGVPGSSASSSTTVATAAAADEHGDCPAQEHRNLGVTGLNPDDIPKLPVDYSFSQVAADGCSPVRWNPCEPVRYVINATNAPPTGVADVKEAFVRLATATGMTYVDDGLTDEVDQGPRAYQPERYPGRWAPVLVHWTIDSPSQGDVQIVGGGFPARVGDVYVTASLFLNPTAVINTARTPVPGGFADTNTSGAIGPEGVTWGRVILHELGHITGLGHVSDASQLMYPETAGHTGPTAFSGGDLAGIKLLGNEAGCLETPAPSAEAASQRDGGGGVAGQPPVSRP